MSNNGSDGESKRSILYVEDEIANWEVAKLCLSRNFDLIHACNAQEAFDALRDKTFDAILMDIELQGSELNGIDIVRVLKGRFEGELPGSAEGVQVLETPIVFFTAYAEQYSKDTLRDAGGAELATKPADFRKLADELNRLIEES